MKTSREKAEEFFIACNGGIDFFEEEIDRIAKILDQHAAEQREACINSMKKLVQQQNWNYADAIFDALYQACEDARIEE